MIICYFLRHQNPVIKLGIATPSQELDLLAQYLCSRRWPPFRADRREHLSLCALRLVKTHWLGDTFAEDGEDEDGRDGRGEVTGDRLDVVEELAALGRLHDGDPRYAHPDEDEDENSAARQG